MDQPSQNGFLEHWKGSINEKWNNAFETLWRSESFCISFKQDKFHRKQVCRWWVMRFFRFQPLLGQQRQHQILIFEKKLKITSHLEEFMNMGSFDLFHSHKWGARYEKSCFVSTWKNFKLKKTLKFHLELNFNNFQERRDGKVLGWLLW